MMPAMSGEALEILVVPYDVERRDIPTARGARGLLEHGFADRESPRQSERPGVEPGRLRDRS